jgi:hypothetical protein
MRPDFVMGSVLLALKYLRTEMTLLLAAFDAAAIEGSSESRGNRTSRRGAGHSAGTPAMRQPSTRCW